jgi:hypothetical protein
MTRWLSLVVAVAAAASLGGCNSPTCGKGTKQVQNSDGSLQCVQTDSPASSITCDVDGGAVISGGICRSAISCGQGTTLVNGVCIGSGGSGPPPCPPPDTGKICINGVLHNLTDNAQFSGGTVHMGYYSNPFDFLKHLPPTAEIDSTNGTFLFANVDAPQLRLLAIATGDADLGTTNNGAKYVTTGSGGQNIDAGKSYRIDGYVIERTQVDAWKTQTGFDWFASGGYIAKFYSDPKPADTVLAATETKSVMGVQLTVANMTGVFNPVGPPTAMYFSTDLATLSSTATATSAVGAVIAVPPAQPGNYSGMGGSITWETETGGSAPKAMFVSRFHPNM